MVWTWLFLPLAALAGAAGYLAGRRQAQGSRGALPWRRPLLLVDGDAGHAPLAALAVACRLLAAGQPLPVLAPVRLPLSVPLDAPPGEEMERAAELLAAVERVAGDSGVVVRGHLCRGRTVRAVLRQKVEETGADVVVLQGSMERLAELVPEVGGAQPLLVPERP